MGRRPRSTAAAPVAGRSCSVSEGMATWSTVESIATNSRLTQSTSSTVHLLAVPRSGTLPAPSPSCGVRCRGRAPVGGPERGSGVTAALFFRAPAVVVPVMRHLRCRAFASGCRPGARSRAPRVNPAETGDQSATLRESGRPAGSADRPSPGIRAPGTPPAGTRRVALVTRRPPVLKRNAATAPPPKSTRRTGGPNRNARGGNATDSPEKYAEGKSEAPRRPPGSDPGRKWKK